MLREYPLFGANSEALYPPSFNAIFESSIAISLVSGLLSTKVCSREKMLFKPYLLERINPHPAKIEAMIARTMVTVRDLEDINQLPLFL